MKTRVLSILASALFLGATALPALAQNSTNPPPATLEKPAAVPDRHGTGTAPEGKGSTGWTGGHRGAADTEAADAGPAQRGTPTSEAAKDQPLMATGVDLKGPPMRFAPDETPE